MTLSLGICELTFSNFGGCLMSQPLGNAKSCCTGHAKDLHAAMALSSLDVGLLKLQAPNLWCLRSYMVTKSVDPGHSVYFQEPTTPELYKELCNEIS